MLVLTLGSSWVGLFAGRNRDAVHLLPGGRVTSRTVIPQAGDMIELRTPSELDAMRAVGAVVADMLAAVRATAAPGVRLTQLDAVARDVLADAGATSPFLGTRRTRPRRRSPTSSACRSTTRRCTASRTTDVLRDGDLLSIDMAAGIDGWVADSALSFIVGTPARPT